MTQQQYEDWHREQTEYDMIRKSYNNKREGMSFTTIDNNREDDRQPDMCAHCNLNTSGEHERNCPLTLALGVYITNSMRTGIGNKRSAIR